MQSTTLNGPMPGDTLGIPQYCQAPAAIAEIVGRTTDAVYFRMATDPNTHWHHVHILDVLASLTTPYDYVLAGGAVITQVAPQYIERLYISNLGVRQIETPMGVETTPLWAARLAAWEADHTQPYPLVQNHARLIAPRDYYGVCWWIVTPNVYVETITQTIVCRSCIHGTNHVIHTVWEPCPGGLPYRSHMSISTTPFDSLTWPNKRERTYGTLMSRRLDPVIDLLPAGQLRIAACRAAEKARAETCYGLIRTLFPYTQEWGSTSDGVITVTDQALREEVQRG